MDTNQKVKKKGYRCIYNQLSFGIIFLKTWVRLVQEAQPQNSKWHGTFRKLLIVPYGQSSDLKGRPGTDGAKGQAMARALHAKLRSVEIKIIHLPFYSALVKIKIKY